VDARRFFYISAGILCLAAAYNLGATRTSAQGSATFAGIAHDSYGQHTIAITTAGDVYTPDPCGWSYVGSVLGGPVPVDAQSFGKAKAAHR
jgi:hypothetical protein